MNLAFRHYRRSPDSLQLESEWKATRNRYFHTIRTTKETHWQEFLANTDENEIYTAYRYTKDHQLTKIPTIRYNDENGTQQQASEFKEKTTAFLNTLFPPQPPDLFSIPIRSVSSQPRWEWPELINSEIESALLSSNNKKAPGNDGIGFTLLKRAYKIAPELFNGLYKACFQLGYHPRAWRDSVGIILPKPNKPDYSIPKAYRIISLLNCIGKVLEKVFANRLGYLANVESLLDDSQLGGRQQHSAIDTAFLLLYHIESK